MNWFMNTLVEEQPDGPFGNATEWQPTHSVENGDLPKEGDICDPIKLLVVSADNQL